jgi:hypothetical protein
LLSISIPSLFIVDIFSPFVFRLTFEFTGAERLYRTASGGMMDWASLEDSYL